jgi:hypothetical protein
VRCCDGGDIAERRRHERPAWFATLSVLEYYADVGRIFGPCVWLDVLTRKTRLAVPGRGG